MHSESSESGDFMQRTSQQMPQKASDDAIALVLRGELAAASKASALLQKQYPRDADARFAQLMCLLLEVNDGTLKTALDKCLPLHSTPYVGQILLTLQSYRARDYEAVLINAVAAHKLNPVLPFALIIAARAQVRLDRFTEAFHNFTKACAMFDAPEQLRIERLRCLEQIEATKYSQPLADGAIEYLQQAFLNHTQIARLVSSLITRQLALDTDKPNTDFDAIAGNSLLTMALDRLILRDSKLELLLIQTRQYLLVQLYQQTGISDALLDFAARLGMQCFHNEYVYDEVTDEALLVNELLEQVEAALAGAPTDSTSLTLQLLAIALYRPLYSVTGIGNLGVTAPHPLTQLLEVTVQNPQRERELAKTIPQLGAISDDISLRVKQQYEQNPYPRWISFDQLVLRKNYFESMKADYVAPKLRQPSAANPTRVLIAGCGTGQHAISVARRYDHVTVTAIDISMASLAYARRMASQYRVSNIEFIQCDILSIASLQKTFEVIESVGTLHHMQSPDDGLRALTQILAPNGILRIGLYSQLARENINTIRSSLTAELISQFDVTQFRHVRNQLMLKLYDNSILGVADFFSSSGCRDLLCHVHEHQYTIAGLQQLLDNCGLQFQGFNFQRGRSLGKLLYKKHYGSDAKMQILERWDVIEKQTPDLFADMYTFYASKN